jgi:antitoxin component of MazEF toxin-antitoxin module
VSSMPKKEPNLITDASHFRKAGNSMSVVIPKTICNEVDWKEGDLLILRVHDNLVLIQPAQQRLTDLLEANVKETPYPN